MTITGARIFRSALEGVKFLHDKGWIHCDLKPANIGITAGKAVLLDLGQARRLEPGELIQASPGSSGTNGYLSPEREYVGFNQSADIWAMEIVGYKLTYGSNPLWYRENPWIGGQELEPQREVFHGTYEEMIDRLLKDHRKCLEKKRVNTGHFHGK